MTRSATVLPAPLTGSTKVFEAKLEDVPTSEALAAWLLERGLDTAEWGAGDTKDVSKFWHEIENQESAAEVWRKLDGSMQPVRVTHVLRAKVTSLEFHEQGVFLLNTWQQFGDGRKRVRNGLLSEKLTIDEMPLEEHLHEVCRRAVTEEEMQRVVDSEFHIEAGKPPPEYDPNYTCPIEVVTEHLVEHVIEVENSKSYPGLLTMYHLYTVEIICSGLPSLDLNTLEFDHPDSSGYRKLKYVHAWQWLEWPKIQRFLLESSTPSEMKTKGSFADCDALDRWLRQFHLDLDAWGTDTYKSTDVLWRELEDGEAQLELWSREDGVSLLVRAAHVLQVRMRSSDPTMNGMLLMNTWTQMPNGKLRMTNRLLGSKLGSDHSPFTPSCLERSCREIVSEQLSYLADKMFSVNPKRSPTTDEAKPSGVKFIGSAFKEKRSEVDESPSYKGLFTMYYQHCVEAECDGLPSEEFATLEFKAAPNPLNMDRRGDIFKYARGWRWVTECELQDTTQSMRQQVMKSHTMASNSSGGSPRSTLPTARVSWGPIDNNLEVAEEMKQDNNIGKSKGLDAKVRLSDESVLAESCDASWSLAVSSSWELGAKLDRQNLGKSTRRLAQTKDQRKEQLRDIARMLRVQTEELTNIRLSHAERIETLSARHNALCRCLSNAGFHASVSIPKSHFSQRNEGQHNRASSEPARIPFDDQIDGTRNRRRSKTTGGLGTRSTFSPERRSSEQRPHRRQSVPGLETVNEQEPSDQLKRSSTESMVSYMQKTSADYHRQRSNSTGSLRSSQNLQRNSRMSNPQAQARRTSYSGKPRSNSAGNLRSGVDSLDSKQRDSRVGDALPRARTKSLRSPSRGSRKSGSSEAAGGEPDDAGWGWGFGIF